MPSRSPIRRGVAPASVLLATTLVLGACGGTASTAASGAAAAGAPQTISFGVVSKTATVWPLFVAQDKGFFTQQGVKVDVITTGASNNTVQQLVAGSLNMGEGSPVDVVRAVNQGAPIKAIVNNVGTPPYSFMAQPSIKTWSDLKGKTLIIGGSKDITLIFFEAMAKANGLTNPQDYTLTYAGATSDRYAALKSGSVAAAILFPPFNFLAQSEGYTDLGEVEQYLPEFPFDFWDANTSWLASHKDAATRFARADLSAIKWLYDPANKDEAVKILTETSNTKPDAAAQTYDLFFQKLKDVYPKDGRFSEKGMQQVLDALVELGDMSKPLPPVSKYIDETYIKAAGTSS